MKRLVFLFLLVTGSLFSQSIDPDAYGYYDYARRFSSNELTGGSRMLGLGGAQAALGADIGGQYINPAALGVYRKSDWGISFDNHHKSTKSVLETNQGESKTFGNSGNFNVRNFGMIFGFANDNPDENEGWNSGGFGISFTRTNNYHQQLVYQGSNSNYSFRNFLVESASGTHFSSFLNQLDASNQVEDVFGAAYYAFILNTKDESSSDPNLNAEYFTIDGDKTDEISGTVTSKGRKQQWNIGYGANYEDKLYLGLNVAILTLRYELSNTYKESPNVTGGLTSVEYSIDETTRGVGFGLSFGAIYRPADRLRLGFAYEMSTNYALQEDYQLTLTAQYDQYNVGGVVVLEEETFKTQLTQFDYNLKQPSRITFGGAYFFDKKGFISADVDLIGYNKMRLTSTSDAFVGDNNTIGNIYRTAPNIRLGGEVRKSVFRARVGVAHYGNPYRKGFDAISLARNYITLGAGIKQEGYYIDLAAVQGFQKEGFRPYSFDNGEGPVVAINQSSLSIVLTGGLTF